MVGESTLPRWRYLFDCRKCAGLRRVDDEEKKRHGNYCIPTIDTIDSGEGSWGYIFDDDARTISCPRYEPASEQMSLFDNVLTEEEEPWSD